MKYINMLLRVLVGLVIIGFAGYSQLVELRTDRNGWHQLGYYVVMVFGAVVIVPKLFIYVKNFVVLGAPLVPGGRRFTDPPAPPKDGAP